MKGAAGVSLVFLSLTSCLEVEETISIHADGSGTQKLTASLSEQALAAMRRAAGVVDASMARVDPLQVFAKASVAKELTAAGLKLVDHRTEDRRRGRTVAIDASFRNLGELRRSPLTGRRAEWAFLSGARKGTMHAVLYLQGKEAWKRARKRAAEMSTKLGDLERQFFTTQKAKLAGLSIELTIELPGDVLACSKNLTKTGPRTVAASVDTQGIRTPKDLVLELAPRFEVLFDATRCTFKADSAVPRSRPPAKSKPTRTR